MSVCVRFTPTRADLIRGSVIGLLARPVLLAVSFVFFVVLPLGLALFTVWTSGSRGVTVDWWKVSSFVMIPIVMTSLMAILPLWLVGRSKALRGEHVYEFTADGMRFAGPSFENRCGWEHTTSYMQTGFGLTLLADKLPLVNVPQRVLTDDVRGGLLELLRAKGIPARGRRIEVTR
jgi:hypothetical protein